MKNILKAFSAGCTLLTGFVMVIVLVTGLINVYFGTDLGFAVGPIGSKSMFDSPKNLIDILAWEVMLGVFFSICLILWQMDWIWEKIKKYPVLGVIAVLIYVILLYVFFYFLMKDIRGGDIYTAIEKNDAVVLQEMMGKRSPEVEKSGYYFIEAARFDSLEVIPVLVKNGYDVNGGNDDGTTALMAAAGIWFRPAMVEFLLKQGASPDVKDKEGNTALALALKNFDKTLVSQEDLDKIVGLLKK